MTNTELEQADKLEKEYMDIMHNLLNVQQRITEVHSHLQAAIMTDHNKNHISLAQAKRIARLIDETFEDGILYTLTTHEEKIEALNAEIRAEAIEDKDYGVMNKDFFDGRHGKKSNA